MGTDRVPLNIETVNHVELLLTLRIYSLIKDGKVESE